MTQGWVSLHRKIRDNKLFKEKRTFSKFEAWIDLLLEVNHQDAEVLLGNEVIKVKRGQTITSIRQLCERWNWSNTKVKRFCELLEVEQMLIVKSDTKKTLLTIVNYDFYQDCANEKTTQKRHENTSQTTQKHTNNNDNNENKKPLRHKCEPCDMENAQYLFSLMLENNPTAKEPNFDKWANDFRLLRERDERSVQEIKRLIEWTQNDEFWKGNILSPSSLRKQWDRLVLKVDSKPKRQENTSNALSGVANEWEALLKND